MGVHGQALHASFKSPSTMPGVRREAATELWSSRYVLYEVTYHTALSGSLMDELCFGGSQENITCLSALTVKFGGGRIVVWS